MNDERLPPRVPPELPELRRAISLLAGYRQRRETFTATAELVGLIGRLPASRTEAQAWARNMRDLRDEAEAEPDPEGDAR